WAKSPASAAGQGAGIAGDFAHAVRSRRFTAWARSPDRLVQDHPPRSRSCPPYISIPDHRAIQIVSIGALDLHGGEFADPQWPARRHVGRAVDLRGIALGSAFGPTVADFINDDLLAGADVALEAARRDRLLALHQTAPARFLHVIRHRRREIVGSGAFHRLVAEAADP